jgi:hypothetical protein
LKPTCEEKFEPSSDICIDRLGRRAMKLSPYFPIGCARHRFKDDCRFAKPAMSVGKLPCKALFFEKSDCGCARSVGLT